MHGDALCTDDRAYQRLRATVRQRRVAGGSFMALTVACTARVSRARHVTVVEQHTAAVEHETITDVNAGQALLPRLARLRHFDAACTATRTGRRFIALRVDGRPCTRIVLGDWHDPRQHPHAGITRARSYPRCGAKRPASLRTGPNESGTHRIAADVMSSASTIGKRLDARLRDRQCRLRLRSTLRARSK